MTYAVFALIPYWIAVYRNTIWQPFLFLLCLLGAWTVTGWIAALIAALMLEKKGDFAPAR